MEIDDIYSLYCPSVEYVTGFLSKDVKNQHTTSMTVVTLELIHAKILTSGWGSFIR